MAPSWFKHQLRAKLGALANTLDERHRDLMTVGPVEVDMQHCEKEEWCRGDKSPQQISLCAHVGTLLQPTRGIVDRPASRGTPSSGRCILLLALGEDSGKEKALSRVRGGNPASEGWPGKRSGHRKRHDGELKPGMATLREVWVRVVPLTDVGSPLRHRDGVAQHNSSSPPRASFASGSRERVQLLEFLGLMFEDFRIASCDQSPNKEERETANVVPANRRHSGLVPLLSPAVESRDAVFLMFDCLPLRLSSLTQLTGGFHGTSATPGCSPILPLCGLGGGVVGTDVVLRFVFFQLLQAVDFLHGRGLAVGNLSSRNIMLSQKLWVHILPSLQPVAGEIDGRVRVDITGAREPHLRTGNGVS
ncbi:unnamed protein product, partial [Discosporangium mesarthrocarpum]